MNRMGWFVGVLATSGMLAIGCAAAAAASEARAEARVRSSHATTTISRVLEDGGDANGSASEVHVTNAIAAVTVHRPF
jgi:hypothetical protein